MKANKAMQRNALKWTNQNVISTALHLVYSVRFFVTQEQAKFSFIYSQLPLAAGKTSGSFTSVFVS